MTTAAVAAALHTGYRQVDTAGAYSNEKPVGEGLRRSGPGRSEVFIETKVWVPDFGRRDPPGFGKSARKPGVEQIDLLILHRPAPDRFEETIAAYKALKALLANVISGRTRSGIG